MPPYPPVDALNAAPLTPEELARYARHLSLPQVGREGQERLREARVALVGTGGLGSPAALYLAAAGVGTLGLIDYDAVEASNLHRQIIHGTDAVGRSKLASAAARLEDLNPHVAVERFETRLSSEDALEVLRDFDIVVDGSDNFPTRYLVNDACVLLGKPNVYGSIFRFEGQVSVFDASRGPCYRCLFRDPPPPGLVPSCAEGGVIGVLPGIIGSMQALEVIKLIVGIGEPLVGRLVIFDALAFRTRELTLHRDPECPVCGETPTVTSLIDYEAFCGTQPSSDMLVSETEITVSDLATALAGDAPPLIVDVREPHEFEIGHIAGAQLIPLREIPHRCDALDPSRTIVTVCHRGIRSLHAQEFLVQRGFANVRSLRGGMDAWSLEIDPSIPRY